MKRTHTLQLAVAVALVLALMLSGCQSTNSATSAPASASAATVQPSASAAPSESTGASEPAKDQPVIEVKVSVWDIQNSFPDGQPDAIAKLVADKFKLKLTPVNVGWGDADEKYNTWAASGQLPDIIGAVAQVGQARYFQWINDGVVRALPSDLSAYPEIAKLMEQPEVKAFAVDGKNYFLPRQTYSDASYWSMDRGLIVRKDWMDKLGIADPKTEDDYINMAVAFATKDPDGNGKADTVGFTPAWTGVLYSQCWTGFGYTDGRWIKEADGKYYQGVSTDRALTLFKFLKKMYKAGGLDPDFATLESNQALEKFASGKAGMIGRQMSPKHLKVVMDAWVKAQPDKDFASSITILRGPSVDGNYTRFAEMGYWSESYFEAKVDDAKMQRILQLYDWLYSQEGMNTMLYGIEGTDWKKDNGAITLLTPIDEKTGLHTATSTLYPFTSAMGSLAAWSADLMQYEDPSIPDNLRKMATEERDYRATNWKTPDINWSVQAIDVPEKQEMAAVKFGDDWVKFVMDTSGKSDDELYAQMKKNWDANGYAAAVDAITAKAKELGIN